jgi:hypothetical protein
MSQLMTSRDRLRSELAVAEGALLKTVVWSHSRPGEEDPLIESARTACRRIKAEFDRLEHLVDQTTPPGRIEFLLTELRSLKVDQLVARKPASVRLEAVPPPAVERPAARWRRLHPVDPKSLRQSLGLLALVLAFLAYYHLDVQLQILTLPSSGLEQWHKRAARDSDILLGELPQHTRAPPDSGFQAAARVAARAAARARSSRIA